MSDFANPSDSHVSGYSLRYGVSHPDVLAQRAVERGMDAVALIDRDGVGGAMRFAKASARAGVQAVFGVDLAVGMPAEPDLRRRVRAPARGGVFGDESVQLGRTDARLRP